MSMCRQFIVSTDESELTEAYFAALVLASGQRAHIVDGDSKFARSWRKIVEDVWIGEEGRAVDVRQFVSALSGSLAGRIDRGKEAKFAGLVMPERDGEPLLIVMDIRESL